MASEGRVSGGRLWVGISGTRQGELCWLSLPPPGGVLGFA